MGIWEHRGTVAFGNSSWVKVEAFDRDITWSEGLPQKLWNLLNGRYTNCKQENSPVTIISYDDEKFFVGFDDGGWRLGGNYSKTLAEHFDESTGYMDFFSFGSNNSYIFATSESV